MFAAVSARLSFFLKATFDVSARVSAERTQRLLGQILFPIVPRALFGLEDLVTEFAPRGASVKVDLKPVRRAVAELIESLTRDGRGRP
jgi:hypothetical protein